MIGHDRHGALAAWVTLGIYALVLWLPVAGVFVLSEPLGAAGEAAGGSAFDVRLALMLLANSSLVAAGTVGIGLLLAVPMAFCLAGLGRRRRAALLQVGLVPLVLPPFLVAIVWVELLGSSGALSRLVEASTGVALGPYLYSRAGAACVLALCLFPALLWAASTALARLDSSLTDDARLSAGDWRVFVKAALPMIAPSVGAASVLVFVMALGEFGVPNLLLVNQSAASTHTYPVWVFTDYQLHHDVRRAAWQSLPLMLVSVAPVAVLARLWHGDAWRGAAGGAGGGCAVAARRGRWLRGSTIGAVVLASVALPFAVLLARSGGADVYARALSSYAEEIHNTCVLSALTAVLGAGLAFAGAVAVGRLSRAARAATYLIMLPLAIPPTVTGIGLIAVYNRAALDLVYASPAIVLLGWLARFLPMAFLVVRAAVQATDASCEEAAQAEGATWWQAQWRVVLPAAGPGLAVASVLLFVLCAGELPVSILVSPPGWQTLAISLNGLTHYGHTPEVAALSLVLAALTACFGSLCWVWLSRSQT